MELTAIPGIGEKTARALAELEDPIGAIERGDVFALAGADGVTTGQAVNIVRAGIRRRYGVEHPFLATDRADAVHAELLALLTSFTATDYAAKRLETFVPTGAPAHVEDVRDRVERAMERDPDPAVRDAMAGLAPLDEPAPVRVRDRCLATGDAERAVAAREAIPELSVEIIDRRETIRDLAAGYAHVTILDETYAGADVPENVTVDPNALETPAETVPERILTTVAANRESITAAIAVHRHADLEPPLDLARLAAAIERVDEDGTPVADDELARLQTAVDDLDTCVSTATSVANDRVRQAIRERDVTIEGADLLSMAEQGAGVEALLTRELADDVDAAIEDARTHLIDALALTPDERERAAAIFDVEPSFPVEPNDRAVTRFRDEIVGVRDRRAATLKQDLATALAEQLPAIGELIDAALELDVDMAIAAFAAAYDCTMPTFSGPGVRIVGGRSPLLDLPPDEIEPIEYAVDDVVLLSGVNSGGKTSVLDLVAATVILAHMGFPVPADEVELQYFDSLHYHAATQGTVDAGAFEATLREFAAVVDGPDGRLVLVDELESITEPGAAAIIVGGIIEALREGAIGIVVSHLAGEIRDVADVDVRVDGIRAEGVVDGELVVNRSPVPNHHARSTPELIVESLASTASDDRVDFYRQLLEKFDGQGQTES